MKIIFHTTNSALKKALTDPAFEFIQKESMLDIAVQNKKESFLVIFDEGTVLSTFNKMMDEFRIKRIKSTHERTRFFLYTESMNPDQISAHQFSELAADGYFKGPIDSTNLLLQLNEYLCENPQTLGIDIDQEDLKELTSLGINPTMIFQSETKIAEGGTLNSTKKEDMTLKFSINDELLAFDTIKDAQEIKGRFDEPSVSYLKSEINLTIQNQFDQAFENADKKISDTGALMSKSYQLNQEFDYGQSQNSELQALDIAETLVMNNQGPVLKLKLDLSGPEVPQKENQPQLQQGGQGAIELKADEWTMQLDLERSDRQNKGELQTEGNFAASFTAIDQQKPKAPAAEEIPPFCEEHDLEGALNKSLFNPSLLTDPASLSVSPEVQSAVKTIATSVSRALEEGLDETMRFDSNIYNPGNFEELPSSEKLTGELEYKRQQTSLHTQAHQAQANHELVRQIEELEKNLLMERQKILQIKSQNEELQADLKTVKSHNYDDVEEYKRLIKKSQERMMALESGIQNLQQKLEQSTYQSRLDLRQIRQKEIELENQLELIKHDAQSQVDARDKKIIELKRKIDTLEFNMENMAIKEKKAREDKVVLEDKLTQIVRTLKISLQNIQNDLEHKDDILHAIKELKNEGQSNS